MFKYILVTLLIFSQLAYARIDCSEYFQRQGVCYDGMYKEDGSTVWLWGHVELPKSSWKDRAIPVPQDQTSESNKNVINITNIVPQSSSNELPELPARTKDVGEGSGIPAVVWFIVGAAAGGATTYFVTHKK